MLRMKQVDGVIICSKTMPWEQIERYSAYGPIVVCEETHTKSVAAIYHDHYSGFELGFSYLIEKGHTRFGYCLGRPESGGSLRRRQAYEAMVASIQGEVREEWVFPHCYSIEDGVAVVEKLLSMKERPTALLVTGDQVAAGLMMEARRHGIEIPEDLAIISFDNQPIAQLLGLTTIDTRLFEMGSSAFRLAHDHITDEHKPKEQHRLSFQLIERSTV